VSDEKRLITAEDLTQIKYTGDPQFSPDGQWIAYVVTTPDLAGKGYNTHIWVVNRDGSELIQISRGGKDSRPRWSPDGKTLAFISARGGAPQIYLLPMGFGGEARAVTSNANGAMGFSWSPDGTHLAYISPMNTDERAEEDSDESPEPPQDELEGKYRKDRKAEDSKKYFDPMLMTRIPYRSGTSYMNDRTTQVYVIAVDESFEGDDAKAKRLTDIDTSHNMPQWSPDGKYIYTSRSTDPEADESWRNMNLFRIEVETGDVKHYEDAYSVVGYEPSPDGKWLILARYKITDELTKLTLMSAETGEMTQLNDELDRGFSSWHWTNDSELYVTVDDNGDIQLHHVNIADKTFTPIITGTDGTQTLMIRAFDRAEDGAVAFDGSTPENPAELYIKLPDQDITALTTINQDFLDEVIYHPTHELRYESPAGADIQGWYILPSDYEEGKKYPLALNIHGGPHVMWSNSERTMWHEWQHHAAEGYVVFFCNPRGSDGYGQAHLNALHSAWGDVAMTDVMAGVDKLIEMGIVDESRMAITGGSYGGYMTAWIIGHTDRFISAVAQRGVYNLSSFYGTSDVPSLISLEFDTEPWENHEKLWEHSPLAYAHKMTTPLLIIHSENDFRVPIEQGEQLFAFVRRSGGTVKMLRYPREGHELSRSGEPAHRISRLTEMMTWFNTYCQPDKLEVADESDE